MARLEQGEKIGVPEYAVTVVRDAGVVAAVLGTVLYFANAPLGATLFWGGVGAAAAGEIGRRVIRSGKK